MERCSMFTDRKTQYYQEVKPFQLKYRLNAISIKIPSYLMDINKLILAFI